MCLIFFQQLPWIISQGKIGELFSNIDLSLVPDLDHYSVGSSPDPYCILPPGFMVGSVWSCAQTKIQANQQRNTGVKTWPPWRREWTRGKWHWVSMWSYWSSSGLSHVINTNESCPKETAAFEFSENRERPMQACKFQDIWGNINSPLQVV